MKFSTQKLITVFSVLLLLTINASSRSDIKFKADFPDNKVFTSKDTFSLDLSHYIEGTFDVKIQTDKSFENNIIFKNPLSDISKPGDPLSDRDCRNIEHIEKKRDFLMLCGNNGFNLLYMNVNDINQNLDGTFRMNIKRDSMTQDLSIKKCHTLGIGQKSLNGFIVCESSIPKGQEKNIQPDLYLMALSLKGQVKVTSVKIIKQTKEQRLNGELDLLIHSTIKKDQQGKESALDIITIIEKVSFGSKTTFHAWTSSFSSGAFTDPVSMDNSNLVGALKEEGDSLYEIIPATNETWLVYKRSPKAKEGEEQKTKFALVNCGLPAVIDEGSKKSGFKCQSPLDIFELENKAITDVKFLFSIIQGSSLNPISQSAYELVVTSKLGIWGGDLALDSASSNYKYTQTVQYDNDKELNKIKEPLNAFIVDNKIYFSVLAEDEDQKGQDSTHVFVYYAENDALSKAFEPSNGDGQVYIRPSVFAGDFHELFFIGNKISSYSGIQTRPFGVEFLLNYKTIEGQTSESKDVSVTFTIPANKEDDKQRVLNFKIINDPKGTYSSKLNGRATKVYTGSKFRLPTYVDDFEGNGVNFEASTNYVNPATKKPLVINPSYSGSRKIKVEPGDREALAFINILDSYYLENDRFALLDSNKGLMLIGCADQNTDDPTTDIKCVPIATEPYNEKGKTGNIPGKELVTLVPGKKYFYSVFKDKEDNNQGYVFIRDYTMIQESREAKSYKIDFKFKSAGIFIHNGTIYIYMVSEESATTNGELKVISFEETNSLPEKLEIQDVSGIPDGFLCPYKLEFFPHKTPEFAIGSICTVNGIKIHRIFQFKILIDRKTDKYVPQKVILTTTHNENTFLGPDFCLTDNYIHVFETKSQTAESGAIMKSVIAKETEGSSIYIPIRETNNTYKITHVNSFYCDRQKNAVIVSVNQSNKSSPDVYFTGIITVDTGTINNPNKRIHSSNENTGITNLNIVAGSKNEHDQMIILATSPNSDLLMAYYASLNGPHFRYNSYDLTIPTMEEIQFNVKMMKAGKAVANSNMKLIISPFNLKGKISYKGATKPEMSVQTQKVISMQDVFNFDGAIIGLKYNSGLKDSEKKTLSEEINSVSPLVNKNDKMWQKITKDIKSFNTFNNTAVYVIKNDSSTSETAIILTGATKQKIQQSIPFDVITHVEVIPTYKSYCVVIIGQKDNKLSIALSAPKKNESWDISFVDVKKANFPEELEDTLIRHSPLNKSEDQIVLNLFSKSNEDAPHITTFTINYEPNSEEKENSEIIGVSRVSFNEPIIDFSVSMTFSEDKETSEVVQQQSNHGAVVVVGLESSKELKFLSYLYKAGILKYSGIQSDKAIVSGSAQSLSHQNSKLDCDPSMKIQDRSNEFEIQCFLATSDTVSAIFKAQVVSFQQQENIKRVIEGDLYLEKQFANLRHYTPKKAIRDGDNLVNLVYRQEGAPKDKGHNYINEDWLILIYRLNLSSYPVHIMTPQQFRVNRGSTIDPKLISIVHEVIDKNDDNLFITIYNPEQTRLLTENNKTKLFNRRITQSTIPTVYAFKIAPSLFWNIKNTKLISPSVDSFSYETFDSKTKSVTNLRDITSNKDDPYNEEKEKKEKSSKSNWVIWICIIVVVALIVGGVVFMIMSKGDDEDYNNLHVDEDGDKLENGDEYNQVEDNGTLTESEYSRL